MIVKNLPLILIAYILVFLSCTSENSPNEDFTLQGNITFPDTQEQDTFYIGIYRIKRIMTRDVTLDSVMKTTHNDFAADLAPGVYEIGIFHRRAAPFTHPLVIKDSTTSIHMEVQLSSLSVPEKIHHVGLRGPFNNWNRSNTIDLDQKDDTWVLTDTTFSEPTEFALVLNDSIQMHHNGLPTKLQPEKQTFVNTGNPNELTFSPSKYNASSLPAGVNLSGTGARYTKQFNALLDQIDSLQKCIWPKIRQTLNNSEKVNYAQQHKEYKDFTKAMEKLKTTYPDHQQAILNFEFFLTSRIHPGDLYYFKLLDQVRNNELKYATIEDSLKESRHFKNFFKNLKPLKSAIDPASVFCLPYTIMNMAHYSHFERFDSTLVTRNGFGKIARNNFYDQYVKHHPNPNNVAKVMYYNGTILNGEDETEKANKIAQQLVNQHPQSPVVKKGKAHQLATNTQMVGQQAPEFKLTTLQDRDLTLKSFEGAFVFVVFWHTRCGGIESHMNYISQMYNQTSHEKLKVIGIGRDNTGRLKNFIQNHDINFPNAVADGKIIEKYGVNIFPRNYLIAPDGRIIAKDIIKKDMTKAIKAEIEAYEG